VFKGGDKFCGFQIIFIKLTAIHAKCDFQNLFFEVGNDLLDHACCAIGCIGVATSYVARRLSLEFITVSKLKVVTGVTWLFRIVSFGNPFLVTFQIDHTAVIINGDGFELAPSQKLSEDFELDLSQRLCRLVTKVFQES